MKKNSGPIQPKSARATGRLSLSLKESQRIVTAPTAEVNPREPTNAGLVLQQIADHGRALNERLQVLIETAIEESGYDAPVIDQLTHCLELCRCMQMNAMEGSPHHLPPENLHWDLLETTRELLEQLRTILPAGALKWNLPSGELKTRIPRKLWLTTLQKGIFQSVELQTSAGLDVQLSLSIRKPREKASQLVLEIGDRGREMPQSEMEKRLTHGLGMHPEHADSLHLLLLLAIAAEGDLEIVSDPDDGTLRRLIMPMTQFRIVPAPEPAGAKSRRRVVRASV